MKLEDIRDRIRSIDFETLYCAEQPTSDKLSGLLTDIENTIDNGGSVSNEDYQKLKVKLAEATGIIEGIKAYIAGIRH